MRNNTNSDLDRNGISAEPKLDTGHITPAEANIPVNPTGTTIPLNPVIPTGAKRSRGIHFSTKEPPASGKLVSLALRYARIALGMSFLCAVADRFGLLSPYGGWGNFAVFTAYTAEVNSFLPAASIPFLAWTATLGETVFGIGLVVHGFLPERLLHTSPWPRLIAFGSSVLLLLFAAAMSISLGPAKPLDYSVFSASACALLLALFPEPPPSSLQPRHSDRPLSAVEG